MLSIEDLHIGYGEKSVAGPISEQLKKGELVCLLGPNGTGKSTLVKTIIGLMPPSKGLISFHQKPIDEFAAKEKSKILSVVLTEPIVIGNLTAKEIVEFGRYPYKGWWGKNTSLDTELIDKAIKSTGIAHLKDRKIAELSDGEKQKIMIARALAQDTDYILLDEPTSHLDLPSKIEIMTLLKQLVYDWKKSVLVSTHDLNLAIQTADKFWLIDKSGSFNSGVNEDLILNGQLNTCFNLEDSTYSFSTGKVSFPKNMNKQIALTGTGDPLKWTKHALERLGYEVQKEGSITIKAKTASKWIVQYEERHVEAGSIAEVIKALDATE